MDPLTSIVQSPLLIKLSGPIVVLAGLLFFWWRVGSLHSIFDRLWRIFAGKGEVKDPVLRQLTQEFKDLEYFRFFYGIRAERSNDVGRLKYWLDRNNIGIARLQKAGKWVNIRSKEIIIEPTEWQLNSQVALCVVWYLLFAFSSIAINFGDAFLQFRDSEKWFRTDGEVLSDVQKRTTVTLELCGKSQNEIAQKMQFSESEVSAICGGYDDKSLQRAVKEGVRDQRWLTGVIGVIALWMAIVYVFKLKAVQAARQLCRELRAAAPKGDSTDDYSAEANNKEPLREHVPIAAE